MSETGPTSIARRGLMLVLSSPSGAGKTTIARRLLAREPELALSVSLTTRLPRPGEQEGVDYFFVTRQTFDRHVADGALLEWALVYDNCYGTPRATVEQTLAAGSDLLFDIDWQGARQLRQAAAEDVVSVFILPPSADALEQRLLARAQDAPEVVRSRMERAAGEIVHWNEYDFVIVNDDFEASVNDVTAILASERLRRSRQPSLERFVNGLRARL